jgi:hypothetical protein
MSKSQVRILQLLLILIKRSESLEVDKEKDFDRSILAIKVKQ